MKSFYRWCCRFFQFCGFFLAIIYLVQAVGATELAPLQTIAITSESGIDAWGGVQDSQRRLWTAIYPTQHRLVLKDPQGLEIPLETDPHAAPSGLALAPGDAGRVWIAYRNKAPERGVMVVRSDAPAKVYKVSGDSLPLARVRLAADGQGGVYVLWYDEHPSIEQPQQTYWLWFNHLDRSGKIGIPERVLPGIYPVWLVTGSQELAVFSGYETAQGNQIGLRRRTSSSSFGPTVEVAKVRYFSPPFAAFSSGTRWLVYWLAQYGELRDDFLLEGASSDDQGNTWKPFKLEALRKLDIRNIAAAADGAGHIALAITGCYHQSQDGQNDKLSAYLVTSNDNGNSWNPPKLLRPDSAAYSQAPNAKVAFVGNGNERRLLVGVEDWRTIRSRIRYWLSADNGSTWLVQDQPLPLDLAFNYQFSYSDQSLYTQADKITFLLERIGDDFTSHTILAYTSSLQSLAHPAVSNPDPKPDLQRLKMRVNAYGQALITRNYQAAYNLFDPFYRARLDFLAHLQSQGRIAYTTAEFVAAQIQGQLATVQFHIVASVPPFAGTSGEIMQSPTRDVILIAHWLWIDNDWFLEYYSEARELRYTHY